MHMPRWMVAFLGDEEVSTSPLLARTIDMLPRTVTVRSDRKPASRLALLKFCLALSILDCNERFGDGKNIGKQGRPSTGEPAIGGRQEAHRISRRPSSASLTSGRPPHGRHLPICRGTRRASRASDRRQAPP